MILSIKVNKIDNETRIDRWLKRNYNSLNQSFIEKNLRKGFIKVNSKKIKANYKVKTEDIIKIYNFSENRYFNNQKKKNIKKIPLKFIKKLKDSIVFENNEFIILNKWCGIATQGGTKIKISIDDIIKKISIKYCLVHRLDKETSGLLIIAKNLSATKIFGNLFKNREIEKIYIAVCCGMPKKKNSTVKLKIKDKNNNKSSSFSITKYKVVNNNNKFSIIFFKPFTGKTHQLRIVSKNIGSPIVGDIKYNPYEKYLSEKLKLNAYYLKFFFNNTLYEFKSKLPSHFNNFILKEKIKFKISEKKYLLF